MAVIRKRVSGNNVGDVLPFDKHVRFTDGVGFIVQFLPVHGQAGVRVVLHQIFFREGEHAARSRCRVVHRAYHCRAGGEHFIVFNKQQVHHKADNFTRCKVFPGCLVGEFGKLSDEFFKDKAHLVIVHPVRVQVYLGKLFRNQIEQAVFMQAFHMGIKVKAFKNISGVGRKTLNIGVEVLANMVLVANQFGQI